MCIIDYAEMTIIEGINQSICNISFVGIICGRLIGYHILVRWAIDANNQGTNACTCIMTMTLVIE